jgi:hypothetical protein
MNFPYQLKRSKRIRSIKLTIDADGQVIVTAPPLIPQFLIEQFLKQQAPWIAKNLAKVNRNRVKLKKDQLFLFGKQYQLLIEENPKQKIGIRIEGEQLILNQLEKTKNQKRIDTKIERFLKNTATKYLSQKTKILAEQMGISYQRIGIRQQKSRWGSCSSQGNLNFNWRLVHYPSEIIDYVIIHELAHRKELNHSKKFWQIVAKYDPDYKKHKAQLKKKLYNG